MMQIRVRAGDGLKVPMPGGKVIDETAPPEGVSVTLDLFVRKCLECHDLVEVKAASAAPTSASKPAIAPGASAAEPAAPPATPAKEG